MKGHATRNTHFQNKSPTSSGLKVVTKVKVVKVGQTSWSQANSENSGPLPGNNFDLEVGPGMVSIVRASHKDHACQVPMLYH